MISTYLKYIQEALSPLNITLGKFDKNFWDSLPNDKDYVCYNPTRGHYYTLLLNNKIKVGIAGVILNPKHKNFGFFGVYVFKPYRGKGILKIAADLIFKKYKLYSLISSIEKKNKASIKGHLKAGFIYVDNSNKFDIIEKSQQKKNQVRLVYRGNNKL